MNLKKRILGLNTLLVTTLLLTACGANATPPPPTLDTNMLFTQAAQTVVAGLTQNAPTLTPTTASTNTPVPSMTPLGGVLPTLPPLATLPSLVKTQSGINANSADKATYMTQSPSDYATVKTNQVFNIIWRMKNTGTTTWNQNYTYRFYSAVNKIHASANGYNLEKTVAPNGEVDLKVVATAAGTPGTYDTLWVLTNPEGVNFAQFNITLTVVQGTASSNVATEAAPAVDCELVVQAGNPTGVDNSAVATDNVWEVGGSQILIYFTNDVTPGVDFTVKIDGNDPEQGATYNTYTTASPLFVTYGQDKLGHSVRINPTTHMQVLRISSYSSNHSCP